MATIQLINLFREILKEPTPEFLAVTSKPNTLSAICYRFGDLLHGRGFDVIGAFELVGYSIVPLFAVIENLPFVFIDDDKISPPISKDDRLLLVCGQITKDNVDFINNFADRINVSAIVTLVESNYSTKFPQLYLYSKRDLGL